MPKYTNKGIQQRMSYPKLLTTALFIFLFSSVGANAQRLIESASNALPVEKNEISMTGENTSEASVISKSGVSRQQIYVRPTKDERRKRYLSDAFGVPALIGSTFGAAINQIGNDPPEWKKTAGGFGKRFASAYGTNAIRNTVSYGLSETFKLNNRFEKSGQKDFGKRLKHVVLGSYTTRTKTGKRIPDFPFVTGTYTAAVIANEVWYPKRYSYQDGFRDGTISLGVRFGVNLLREFIFPK